MSVIELDMKDLYGLIETSFAHDQSVIFKVKGTSMFPLLKDRRDSVKLEKIKSLPKKRDIVLYKRDNGQFVLHRIIKVKDEIFTMCGDNQHIKERNIRRDQILGIVTSIIRKDKEIDLSKSKKYRFYSYVWCLNLFIRRIMLKIIRIFSK